MADQPMSDPTSQVLLRAVGLHKSFHNGKQPIPVLQDLNLILQQGETLAVVGASGIGKSTLLHLLGTLDRPDAGALYYRRQDVFKFSDQRLARFRNRTMGFVFQFHHLLPEFTALENVMMPALIQGTENKTAARMAESVLMRVGLKDRLHHKATALSGGEQQRVALARALALKPALLLADEPTGNLDKGNSEQIHQLLLELNAEMAMAMVVVTHNMELASFMEKQATLADGRLQYLL
jgi:lipoprotein-releasing system ATP-binding protein